MPEDESYRVVSTAGELARTVTLEIGGFGAEVLPSHHHHNSLCLHEIPRKNDDVCCRHLEDATRAKAGTLICFAESGSYFALCASPAAKSSRKKMRKPELTTLPDGIGMFASSWRKMRGDGDWRISNIFIVLAIPILA